MPQKGFFWYNSIMVIKGDKVTLRHVRLSDAERFVKWLTDPKVYQYLQAQNRHLTLKKEKEWIKKSLKEKTDKRFAIETLDKVHIGVVSLERVEVKHKRATLGIFIGEKSYWNKGLGTDAARTILKYGFEKMKLHKVELDVFGYNPRAIKVYRRLGFKKEGVKREHNYHRGKFWDVYHMSILDREWKKQ